MHIYTNNTVEKKSSTKVGRNKKMGENSSSEKIQGVNGKKNDRRIVRYRPIAKTEEEEEGQEEYGR